MIILVTMLLLCNRVQLGVVEVIRCRSQDVCFVKEAAGWCFSGVCLGNAPTPRTKRALCTAAGANGGSGGTAPGPAEGEWKPASGTVTTRSKCGQHGSQSSTALEAKQLKFNESKICTSSLSMALLLCLRVLLLLSSSRHSSSFQFPIFLLFFYFLVDPKTAVVTAWASESGTDHAT